MVHRALFLSESVNAENLGLRHMQMLMFFFESRVLHPDECLAMLGYASTSHMRLVMS